MYEVIFAADRGFYVSSFKRKPDEPYTKPGCTFCAIRDRDPGVFTRRIHMDEEAIVLMNIYPYSPGHLQVIPPRHVEKLEELSHEELAYLMEYLQRSIYLAQETLKPEGYNIGINLGEAGASIPHIHIQLVPRYDNNPSLGQDKIHDIYLKNLDMMKGVERDIRMEDGSEPKIREIGEEVIEGDRIRVGLSSKPYNRGHMILLMPRPFHKETPDRLARIFFTAVKYKAVLERAYDPDGFNIGMNLGKVPQGSSRALHLVPRFRRESGFMEVIASTRIIVETLDEAERKILELVTSSPP